MVKCKQHPTYIGARSPWARQDGGCPTCERIFADVRKAREIARANAREERAVAAAKERNVAPKKEQVAEAVTAALVEKVLDRFGTAAMSQKYDPVVRWSAENKSPKSPGTPMLMLSDIHHGEIVNPTEVFHSNNFNPAISKARIQHTFETAVTLLNNHLAKPDYPGLVLVLGGDMIAGHLRDEDLASAGMSPIEQAIDIARIVADGIAFLAKEFKQVSIYAVPGNHGRTTRKPWAKFYAVNNLDWLAYKMIEDYVRPLANVSMSAPPARDVTFVVAGRRYRLTHGDQFRGGDGIIGPLGPVTRGDVRKRFSAALMPGQPEAYDTMLAGHWHNLIMLNRLIINGSVKGYDEYALSINAPWEPPQQALWTVHPRHGHTWYMPIICDPAHNAKGKAKP